MITTVKEKYIPAKTMRRVAETGERMNGPRIYIKMKMGMISKVNSVTI